MLTIKSIGNRIVGFVMKKSHFILFGSLFILIGFMGLLLSFKTSQEQQPFKFDWVSGYFGDQPEWGRLYGYKTQFVDSYFVVASPQLVIVNMGDLENPTRLGSYDTHWLQIHGMFIEGKHLFLTHGRYGLDIIDISDMEHPHRVDFITYRNFISSNVLVAKDYIYWYVPDLQPSVASPPLDHWSHTEPRWLILDMSDLSDIHQVGERVDLANPLAVSGNYIYAAEMWSDETERWRSLLQIIDITDSRQPAVIGKVILDGWVTDIEVQENRIYLAAGSVLHIVDVTNPAHPVVINSHRGSFFPAIALENDILVSGFLSAYQIKGQDRNIHIEPIAKLSYPEMESFFCESGQLPLIYFEDAKQKFCPISFANIQMLDIAIKDGLVYVSTTGKGILVFKLIKTP